VKINSFFTSALGGVRDQLQAEAAFSPAEVPYGTHRLVGCVGTTVGLKTCEVTFEVQQMFIWRSKLIRMLRSVDGRVEPDVSKDSSAFFFSIMLRS